MGSSGKVRFELAKKQLDSKKEPINKALNLNGGLNAPKFELFRNYYEHINQSSVTNKICYLISSLSKIA